MYHLHRHISMRKVLCYPDYIDGGNEVDRVNNWKWQDWDSNWGFITNLMFLIILLCSLSILSMTCFPLGNSVSAVSKQQHSLKALNKVILYILRTTCKLKVPLKPHTYKTLSSWRADIWIWNWHLLLHVILLKLDNQNQHQTKASAMITWHSNIMNNFTSGSRSHIIYIHNKNGTRPVSVTGIYSPGCGQVKAH